jgi:hypothetical protein
MKAISFSFVFIILLIVAGLLGLVGLQPGLTLVALCALPLATMGLGWSLGRARVRLTVSSDGF